MAKTAKLKKKQAAPHSRAARRAASPSIPVPQLPRTRSTSPKPATARHHVLSTHGAGVSKRKTTKMTRAQRVRAEKAMDRAADDMDKWEKKKAKSLDKARGIKERAKLWDEVNGESERVKSAKADKGENKASVWEDVVDGDDDMDAAETDAAENAAENAAETDVQSTGRPLEVDELL